MITRNYDHREDWIERQTPTLTVEGSNPSGMPVSQRWAIHEGSILAHFDYEQQIDLPGKTLFVADRERLAKR